MACCGYQYIDANGDLVIIDRNETGEWQTTNISNPGGPVTQPLTAVGGCPVCTTIENNGDGTYDVTQTPGSSFVIDTNSAGLTGGELCTLLESYPTAGVLPGSVLVLGDDCQWYNLPAGATDSFVTIADNLDGTATVTSADGANTFDVCLAPCGGGGCTESVTSGGLTFTGEPSGAFVDGCEVVDLGLGDVETLFPAANFPEGWRQLFTNGTTGSENMIVLKDAGTGVNQWHNLG